MCKQMCETLLSGEVQGNGAGDIDHGRGLKTVVDDIVKYCVIYIENPTRVSRAYWLKHEI